MLVGVELIEGFEVAADLGELGGKFGVGVARRAWPRKYSARMSAMASDRFWPVSAARQSSSYFKGSGISGRVTNFQLKQISI